MSGPRARLVVLAAALVVSTALAARRRERDLPRVRPGLPTLRPVRQRWLFHDGRPAQRRQPRAPRARQRRPAREPRALSDGGRPRWRPAGLARARCLRAHARRGRRDAGRSRRADPVGRRLGVALRPRSLAPAGPGVRVRLAARPLRGLLGAVGRPAAPRGHPGAHRPGHSPDEAGQRRVRLADRRRLSPLDRGLLSGPRLRVLGSVGVDQRRRRALRSIRAARVRAAEGSDGPGGRDFGTPRLPGPAAARGARSRRRGPVGGELSTSPTVGRGAEPSVILPAPMADEVRARRDRERSGSAAGPTRAWPTWTPPSPATSSTCSTCIRIPRAAGCTSATGGTTSSATPCTGGSAWPGARPSTRWAGTPSACRPRMPRSRAASRPASTRSATSPA